MTPANERRSVAAPAGPLGFYFRTFANLPNWYLRHGRRDAEWDRQVVAALLQLGTDPALAEACWAEACKRGYRPDRLAACCGMMLALSNGELTRAEAFAKDFVPFEASTSPADFPTRIIDVFRLGFLTGNPQWLLKAGESLRNEDSYSALLDNFRHQVELAKQTPPGTPPPSELAKRMKRRSFLRNFDNTPVRWSGMQSMVEDLHLRAAAAAGAASKEFPPVVLDVELNHYFSYYISPKEPSPNIEVEIQFRAEARPAPPDEFVRFDRCFIFGLADRDHDKVWDVGVPADARILLTLLSLGGNDVGEKPSWLVHFNGRSSGAECEIWTAKSRQMSPLYVPTYTPFPYAPATVHTLRIVRVGGQAEALLDGRRLALVHVPLGLKNPGLYFYGSGCKIHATALRADVLE